MSRHAPVTILLAVAAGSLSIRLAPAIRRSIVDPILSGDGPFTIAVTILVLTPFALRLIRPLARRPWRTWRLPGHSATMLAIALRHGGDAARYVAATSSPSDTARTLRLRAARATRTDGRHPGKRTTARHEAAHAIVALACHRPVTRIQITGDDATGWTGLTEHLAVENDQKDRSRTDLLVALAGNVEDRSHAITSTCSADDIAAAAMAAIELASMGEAHPLTAALAEDSRILSDNQHALENLTDALCREGTLDGWNVRALAGEKGLTPRA